MVMNRLEVKQYVSLSAGVLTMCIEGPVDGWWRRWWWWWWWGGGACPASKAQIQEVIPSSGDYVPPAPLQAFSLNIHTVTDQTHWCLVPQSLHTDCGIILSSGLGFLSTCLTRGFKDVYVLTLSSLSSASSHILSYLLQLLNRRKWPFTECLFLATSKYEVLGDYRQLFDYIKIDVNIDV